MECPAGGSGLDLRQAAVDGELAGGHEAAVVRREKGSRRSDLSRIGHALEQSHRGVELWPSSPSAAFASSVAVGPGDSTFTRMPVPFRSSAQVRARLRTAALLALYTLIVGAPVVPALEPVRMIEPPLPISGSAFWTVKIVPFTLVSKVSSMCSAVILPSGSGLPAPALAKTMSRVPRSAFTAA